MVLLLVGIIWRLGDTWSPGPPSLLHCEPNGSSMYFCEFPSSSLHNEDTYAYNLVEFLHLLADLWRKNHNVLEKQVETHTIPFWSRA